MTLASLRRRSPLLGAGLALVTALALGACVIGPKPEDPAEDKASDAGTVDTSTGADTDLTAPPEAGVVSDATDGGAGGDAAFDAGGDAIDATGGDAIDATDGATDATDGASDGG